MTYIIGHGDPLGTRAYLPPGVRVYTFAPRGMSISIVDIINILADSDEAPRRRLLKAGKDGCVFDTEITPLENSMRRRVKLPKGFAMPALSWVESPIRLCKNPAVCTESQKHSCGGILDSNETEIYLLSCQGSASPSSADRISRISVEFLNTPEENKIEFVKKQAPVDRKALRSSRPYLAWRQNFHLEEFIATHGNDIFSQYSYYLGLDDIEKSLFRDPSVRGLVHQKYRTDIRRARDEIKRASENKESSGWPRALEAREAANLRRVLELLNTADAPRLLGLLDGPGHASSDGMPEAGGTDAWIDQYQEILEVQSEQVMVCSVLGGELVFLDRPMPGLPFLPVRVSPGHPPTVHFPARDAEQIGLVDAFQQLGAKSGGNIVCKPLEGNETLEIPRAVDVVAVYGLLYGADDGEIFECELSESGDLVVHPGGSNVSGYYVTVEDRGLNKAVICDQNVEFPGGFRTAFDWMTKDTEGYLVQEVGQIFSLAGRWTYVPDAAQRYVRVVGNRDQVELMCWVEGGVCMFIDKGEYVAADAVEVTASVAVGPYKIPYLTLTFPSWVQNDETFSAAIAVMTAAADEYINVRYRNESPTCDIM